MSDSEDAATAARNRELSELGARIGHAFTDLTFLQRALCHASTGNDGKANYERLEFLGDAILNFLVAERVYSYEPEIPEGQLTELRARLVAQEPLAEVAQTLRLGNSLEGGRGLRERDRQSPRILADLVEAVIAAVYLDAGMAATRAFVDQWIMPRLEAALAQPSPPRDAKSRLQHLALTRGFGIPTYPMVAESGPPHDRTFEVACLVDGQPVAKATGRSRQLAEKAAAALALEQLAGNDRADGDALS